MPSNFNVVEKRFFVLLESLFAIAALNHYKLFYYSSLDFTLV